MTRPIDRRIRYPLSLFLLCTSLFGCSIQNSRDHLGPSFKSQNSGWLSEHHVSRSAPWTLHSRTLICLIHTEEAKGYQQKVEKSLHNALQRAFVVQALPFLEGDTVAVRAAAANCSVALEPLVLSVGNEKPLGARYGGRQGEMVAGEVVTRITMREVVSGRILDLALIRSEAGVVTPMEYLSDSFVETAMHAYVEQIAALRLADS